MDELPITQEEQLSPSRRALILSCGSTSLITLALLYFAWPKIVSGSLLFWGIVVWLCMFALHIIGWSIVMWKIRPMRKLFESMHLLWIFDVEWYLPGYFTATVLLVAALIIALIR